MKAHDFRLVPGQTHTNIVFDVVIPVNCKIAPDVLERSISTAVVATNPQYRCVIRIERDYA